MRLVGRRRLVRYGSSVVILGVVAIVAVITVSTAQAVPTTKNYTAQVAVTNADDPQTFTVTITNDAQSNQALGSVNVTPPSGFNVDTASTQPGWTATVVDNVVELRSTSSGSALSPGQSLTASVHVESPGLPVSPTTPELCPAGASWSVEAKQSNDFNGQNNSFYLLTNGTDLIPLGSFAFDPIGTLELNGFFAPAILNSQSKSVTVTARDTCGAPKTNYDGPATLSPNPGGLTNATLSGPDSTWSSGVGTITIDPDPTISETDNTLTLTDKLTGITGTSNLFDTQDKICTSADTSCTWANQDTSINASAPPPAKGSLGVGFNPVVTFSCNDIAGGNLGDTVITIAPHGVGAAPYQVTLVYSKAVSGTGNANAYIVCESTNDGSSFQQLPSCASPPTVDCVLDQKRISGGALEIILNLLPGDPYVGTR